MINTNSNICLFVSDMLIDRDLGLIRFISEYFMESCQDYFYQEIVDTIVGDDIAGRYILYKRENANPLTVISKEEISIESLDKLYEKFITDFYDDIIDRAEPTDAMDLLITTGYTSGTVNSTVVCNTKHEEDALREFIKHKGSTVNTVVSKLEDLDISAYDTIVLREYSDVYKFKNLHGKNIIVSDAEYNYVKMEEYNFHELNPLISIYITNNDNELSKMNMYRSYEIDTTILEDEGE